MSCPTCRTGANLDTSWAERGCRGLQYNGGPHKFHRRCEVISILSTVSQQFYVSKSRMNASRALRLGALRHPVSQGAAERPIYLLDAFCRHVGTSKRPYPVSAGRMKARHCCIVLCGALSLRAHWTPHCQTLTCLPRSTRRTPTWLWAG